MIIFNVSVFRRRGRRRDIYFVEASFVLFLLSFGHSRPGHGHSTHPWVGYKKEEKITYVYGRRNLILLTYLNLPSLSKRSDDLHVRSTENSPSSLSEFGSV